MKKKYIFTQIVTSRKRKIIPKWNKMHFKAKNTFTWY